ncbi:MAG: DUF1385 domain-containing protein [Oscillospiraceae bacterium]|nr:DUF1385 domain-containing protein [Oscillospiraceae bacterium]
MAKEKKEKDFRTTIGGQALIEGILMRGVDRQAIVIHTETGPVTKVEELRLIKEKYPILGKPFIRGVVNFADSMVKGVKALAYSAEFMPEEDLEPPSRFDLWIEKRFGLEKAQKIMIGVALVIGMCLAIGLFFVLPTLIAGFLDGLIANHMLRNLAEGGLRLAIFFLYLILCSQMKDIKRTFAYHGAEHKAIFCYEKGFELTAENVREQSRFHPRCGTSFLFVVIIISILVFSVISWSNPFIRVLLRLLLLPVVVGFSYEINRQIGRHDNPFTAALSKPGRLLQRITTNEPDDDMIEVAIEALKLVIPDRKEADAW